MNASLVLSVLGLAFGANPIVAKALTAASLYEIAVQVPEFGDRHSGWRVAREYCKIVDKQLLRVGIRRSPLEPPNGDATLDIDPIILGVPGGVQGDERDMYMFADRQFGVCFNEHTLEHLRSADCVRRAVAECMRVADYAFFLFPSTKSIIANVHPTHYLLVEALPGGLCVTDMSARQQACDPIMLPGSQVGQQRSLLIASAWLDELPEDGFRIVIK